MPDQPPRFHRALPYALVLAVCLAVTGTLLGAFQLRSAKPIPTTAVTRSSTPQSRQIDDFMIKNLRATGLPGAAVVVVRDGAVEHLAGYGTTASATAITPDTPMALGSVAKSVTATGVMQLVEAGKVDLDRPVVDYLPEFTTSDPRSTRITVRQLLNQTSGLADAGFAEMSLPQPANLDEEMLRLRRARLVADPGTQWNYHNPNYHLLARVIERVSGRPYADYMAANVFSPAGMAHSRMLTTPAQDDASIDDGHVDRHGIPTPTKALDHFTVGSGSLISTATDMGSWLSLLLQDGIAPTGKRILTAASIEETRKPASSDENYGFGWMINEAPGGGPRIEHGGVLFTYSANQVLFPDQHLGFAILFNDVTPAGREQQSFTDGLVRILHGETLATGTPLSVIQGIVLANLTVVVIALGLRGVARSRLWARRRSGRNRLLSAIRLGWPLPLIAVSATLPALLGALFGGRDVTWLTIWYGWSALGIMFASLGLASAATLAARSIALLQQNVRKTKK
jgi:CubicO group peptidase (beta-lactamase class C family)